MKAFDNPKHMVTVGDCAEQAVSKFVRKITLCKSALLYVNQQF